MITTDQVLPGDILLEAGIGQISELIKWAGDTDYSHSSFVFSPGLLAEATSSGVHYDVPLDTRARDTVQFCQIDVIRPSSPDCAPISASNLLALQNSANTWRNEKFALNQMVELGIICIIKNKVAPNDCVKLLLWWIFDKVIPFDTHRLICSQFVYLSYHNAVTVPPSIFDPVIEVTRTDGRPFPNIDWRALWKEYEEARQRNWAGGLDDPPAPDPDFVPSDEQLASARDRARSILSASYGIVPFEQIEGIVAGPRLPDPNAATILPQDFADSPTFRPVGRLL